MRASQPCRQPIDCGAAADGHQKLKSNLRKLKQRLIDTDELIGLYKAAQEREAAEGDSQSESHHAVMMGEAYYKEYFRVF